MTAPVLLRDLPVLRRFIIPPAPNPVPVLPAFTLLQPFQDPVGTVRAHAVTDAFRIVPSPRLVYPYDIGSLPDLRPIVFTVQNRTISHTLEVRLTLPDFLRVILANVGPIAAPKENPFVFLVPARGDTTTFPITEDPAAVASGDVTADFQARARAAFASQSVVIQNTILQPTLSGQGIVNLVVTFDEQQATQFLPGDVIEDLIFDVFPVGLTGPMFVDVNAPAPTDLNPLLDVTQSLTVGVDTSAVTPPASETVEVPVIVDREVIVSDFVPRWLDGTTGLLTSGSPPPGWVTEEDGRAYPPFTTSTGPSSTGTSGLTATNTASLTPLEKLVAETRHTPESFLGATRRGYQVTAKDFLGGTQPERVVRETIDQLVADVGLPTQFKLVNWKKTFVTSGSVPDPVTDARTHEFFTFVTTAVTQVRQAVTTGGSVPFHGLKTLAHEFRQFVISTAVFNIITKNEPFAVKASLTADDIQLARSIATAAALIHEIDTNGAGDPVPK